MAGNLTLAMIKPHIHFARKIGQVIQRIEEAGFAIVLCKMAQFRVEGIREFYAEHQEKEFFPDLVRTMTSGPIWVLVLARDNAVEEWRNLIGNTDPNQAKEGTLRHEFGNRNKISENAVHGSADDWAAKREINFFFSREIRLAEKINAFDNERKQQPRRV